MAEQFCPNLEKSTRDTGKEILKENNFDIREWQQRQNYSKSDYFKWWSQS